MSNNPGLTAGVFYFYGLLTMTTTSLDGDQVGFNALLQEEWETGLEIYADEVGYTVEWGKHLSQTGFYFTLIGNDLTEDELLHYVEVSANEAQSALGPNSVWEWSWERVARNTYRVTTNRVAQKRPNCNSV